MLKRYPITVFLAMASLAQPLGHAQSSATQLLVEQGLYWQELGDVSRASEAWNKLLRIEADNADALYGLGLLAAQEGKTAQAQEYVKRLRDPKRQALLEQEIRLLNPAARGQIDTARQLLQRNEYDAAIQAYREAFKGNEPVGPLALEYYQTLAANEANWDAARMGLERLIQNEPNNAKARLALAQLLTYSPANRRQGIVQLQNLSSDPQVGHLAQESWRTALEWLGTPPPPADLPLFQAYLKAYPNDESIAAMLKPSATSRQPAPPVVLSATDQALAQAFRWLEAGQTEQAERAFQSILDKQPKQTQALGGLGLVRLEQQRFAEAAELLEQASTRGHAQRWRQALNAARYWTLFNQAQSQITLNQLTSAQDLLAQAIKLDPREISAPLALANLYVQQGDFVRAEQDFRAILERHPQHAETIQALANVRSLQGASDEALALLESLPTAEQERLGLQDQLAVARLQKAAKTAAARGDTTAQREALQSALAIAPRNPWIRLELGQLYLQQGAKQEARSVVDGLLFSEPNNPDAIYASALIAAADQDWPSVEKHLAALPADKLTQSMRELQQEASLQVQVAQARQLYAQGMRAHAQTLLRDAAPLAQTPSTRALLSQAYADIGDTVQATQLLRAELNAAGGASPDTLLQYVAILAQNGQDAQVAPLLTSLQAMSLTPQQQVSLEALSLNYTLRQVNRLRQRGELAAAYDLLAPWLAIRPNDPDIFATLAWLYQDGGDHKQALAYFKSALAFQPDNVGLLLGATNSALRLNDHRSAQTTIETALALQPNHAEVQATAAQVYRAQGKRSAAIKALEASVALRRRAASDSLASANSNNPFGAIPSMESTSGTVSQQWASMDPDALRSMAVVPPEYLNGQGAAVTSTGPNPAMPTNARPTYRAAPPPAPSVTRMQAVTSVAEPPSDHQNPWLSHQVPADSEPSQPYAAQAGWASQATAQPPAQQQANANIPGLISYRAPGTLTESGNAVTTPAQNRQTTIPANPISALERELQALRAEASPTATGAFVARGREGEAGMSRYTSVETPLEARLPVGNGKVALRVTPVTIDAGRVGGEYNSSSRFGAGPEAALAQVNGRLGSAGKQEAEGVGVAVAYLGDQLQADIGTTPIGMQQTNIVGGITVGTGGGEGPSISATASRRAVTDSLLSFAGATDARTGYQWGGVTATGGRVDVGYSGNDWGIYGHGGAYMLTGHNVVDNSRIEGGIGIYQHLDRSDDHELTVGLNLTGLSYEKNLRHHTFGHGGYFSPQRYVSLSVPIGWTERQGKLRYSISGALGIQNFEENAARYFPGSDQMQLAAQRAAQIAANRQLTSDSSAMYAGQSKTGIGYGLNAAFEYQLAPQWFVGGHVAGDNARDYREWKAGVHMRYELSPTGMPPPLPVIPVKSPY